MPFKTRDFLLFLVTVAFLLIAITTTVVRDSGHGAEGLVFNFSESNNTTDYEVVLPEAPVDQRSDRLAMLRAKIAELGNEQSIANRVTEMEAEAEEALEEMEEGEGEQTATSTIRGVDYCGNYRQINPAWSEDGLEFEITEGARVIYRDLGNGGVSVAGNNGISSNDDNRQFVMQLPLRTKPVTVRNCIATDVVGIALDGSLIRNNEHQLYGIFGKDTLVGYALDGFPIYGTNDGIKTDACGGATALGEYRYYLSTEREGVLGCYSGVPVRI